MPTPIKKLPIMGVRKFRDSFSTLTEPVRVIRATRNMEVLGVWTPDRSRESTQTPDKKPASA